MKHPRALAAMAFGLALTATACGSGSSGDAAKPTAAAKTIQVTMADNSYTPSTLTVPSGTKVTFRFTNEGTVAHEALIGTRAQQADHEMEMSGGDGMGNMSGMDHGTGTSEAMTVKPGRTRTLVRTFDSPGTYLIGCHVPGHYAAGMKATVTVT